MYLLPRRRQRFNDIFDLVQGKWAWADRQCSHYHYISFTPDHGRAQLQYYKDGKASEPFESDYTVLYAEGNSITMLLDFEDRRTENGDRVIWVLKVKNRNVYCWRRTDMASDECSRDIRRCE